MTAAGGWRISPQGGRMDAASFSTGHGCPVEKPRSPHAYLPSKGRKARHPGFRFFWHCHHLGGYFSLLRASCPPPLGPASPFARAPARAWASKEK